MVEILNPVKWRFFNKSRVIPDLRESFSIPYRGGEILALLLDNLGDNADLIKEKIMRNELLCNRPSSPSLVLYELHDTNISYEVAGLLMESLKRLNNKIGKLALGGVSLKGQRNIKQYIKHSGVELNFPVRFFPGLEPAKEWLVDKVLKEY